MTTPTPCPFCHLGSDRIRHENDHVWVIRDGFPITAGHTLLIPKRHIASVFDLSEAEFVALRAALQWAKADIEQTFTPTAYNLGINDGSDAGQTVMHLHVHLIPRYHGDCPDPRGGIRWIMPDKAKYWSD